jgi:hypothetical protein
LCTADDRGLVRLLNYPVVVSDAPSRAYVGHSAHVTAVRFSQGPCCNELRSVDNNPAELCWVATCGGSDRAVFQFRLQEQKELPAPAVEEPEPVWGPLDPSGKVFGWTKQSVDCTTACKIGTSNESTNVSHDLGKINAEAALEQDAHSDVSKVSEDNGGLGDV